MEKTERMESKNGTNQICFPSFYINMTADTTCLQNHRTTNGMANLLDRGRFCYLKG